MKECPKLVRGSKFVSWQERTRERERGLEREREREREREDYSAVIPVSRKVNISNYRSLESKSRPGYDSCRLGDECCKEETKEDLV